jgi:2-oxoglutarate ferredoxin oxidoreductase subunit alpha
MSSKTVERVDHVVIRFAGDSGDGMQLTGDRFTAQSAAQGNDLATLPNYPSEIRAPQGTIAGVSSFQVQFADHDIQTPGDAPNVLVSMNPAALAASLGDLPRGASIIAEHRGNEFTRGTWPRPASPTTVDDGAWSPTRCTVTDDLAGRRRLSDFDLTKKEAVRAMDMFAWAWSGCTAADRCPDASPGQVRR